MFAFSTSLYNILKLLLVFNEHIINGIKIIKEILFLKLLFTCRNGVQIDQVLGKQKIKQNSIKHLCFRKGHQNMATLESDT